MKETGLVSPSTTQGSRNAEAWMDDTMFSETAECHSTDFHPVFLNHSTYDNEKTEDSILLPGRGHQAE